VISPRDRLRLLHCKHGRSFNLIDTLAVGVNRIRRNFELMQRQVEPWRQAQITDERIFSVEVIDANLEDYKPRTDFSTRFRSPAPFQRGGEAGGR
jgi:hypothetical protein